jgi:type IV pilus assembly protein PilC
MWFKYRAKKGDGSTEVGYLSAHNSADAKKQLLGKFVALLELEEQDKGEATRDKPFRVSQEVVAGFFRRLATMLHAGMPLTQSLDYLANSESDRQLAAALEQIHTQVSSGQRLSTSMGMAAVRPLFSKVTVGLIQLGETSGALVDVLFRIADLSETQLRLRRAVVSALTYPSFLFLAILAMGLFFTLVLAPGDASLFSSLGSELPLPTQMMIGLSKKIRSPYWMVGSLGSILLAFTYFKRRLEKDSKFRMRVDALILRLPIVGPLVRKTVSAQMLYVIASSLQVGMPLGESLKLAREVCTNLHFRSRFDLALIEFREGTDLAEALQVHQVFPHLVVTMMAMGLEVGNLEIVLSKISVMYEEDVTSSLTAATQLAEPILLAFAGAMSAFLALATLLPIINVVNTL